ncbi:MAG: pyridoxamine 5'-phosphate oxidase family protein [Chloroflexota bacterium]
MPDPEREPDTRPGADPAAAAPAVDVLGWAADAHALAAFLDEPNLARIGSVDAAGDAHVVPVWFHWDGSVFRVSAQVGDTKVANVRRTGRASLVIDSDVRRKRGILVTGAARLVTGAEARAEIAWFGEEQVRRYLPERPPHETARRMAASGEPVVIVIVPRSIRAWGR